MDLLSNTAQGRQSLWDRGDASPQCFGWRGRLRPCAVATRPIIPTPQIVSPQYSKQIDATALKSGGVGATVGLNWRSLFHDKSTCLKKYITNAHYTCEKPSRLLTYQYSCILNLLLK